MGKAKRSHSSPWLCGGDSTDVAPVGLARKHELRATHVFVNPTTATTDDSSTGASTKKQEEKKRQKSLLSLLTRGASTTWILPNSARKALTCSGSAGELPGSAQLEGEVEQRRRREEEVLRSGEEKDGNTGLAFLYARTAAEVNKITELKAEVENLLKADKGMIPETDKSGESGSTLYGHVTRPLEDGQLWSHEQHSLSHDYVPYGHANYPTARSQMMERVEAELESEVERLQLNFKHNGYEKSRLELEDVGHNRDFFRMDGDDQQEHIVNELSLGCENGVCPQDLERRLYQLRDMQQRKQISELEAALQKTKRTLSEKEMEIQRWPDSNLLVLNAGRNSR